MPRLPSPEDARLSLADHAATRGAELREKYGPHLGWAELERILQDRTCVRYPCDLVFDAAPLQPGEFAHVQPRGPRPDEGFTLFVHPHFAQSPDRVLPLVLYQLVAVNYGPFASPDDAEAFGAAALGLDQQDYYRLVCDLADEIPAARS